jgi:hypothetical protein
MRLTKKCKKDLLRDLLCHRSIAAHAKRESIDHGAMTLIEFPDCIPAASTRNLNQIGIRFTFAPASVSLEHGYS